MNKCKHGCNREGKFQNRKGEWRCDSSASKCPVIKRKNAEGSGGARHGNITAPIFVGGGIAHGPKAKGKHRVKRLNLFSLFQDL